MAMDQSWIEMGGKPPSAEVGLLSIPTQIRGSHNA